jgi:Flp pilus assembly protein TadD
MNSPIEYVFKVTMPPKIDSAAHIKKLEKKLISTSADADLYFELASGYLYEGRLQDVVRCLETAIKEAPPSANVHGLMGQTLRRLGRFDEALAHCQKASALAPGDARIQAELGIFLGELGKHDAALVHSKPPHALSH